MNIVEYFRSMHVEEFLQGTFEKCVCEECLNAFKDDPNLENMIDRTSPKLQQIQKLLTEVADEYEAFISATPSDQSIPHTAQ